MSSSPPGTGGGARIGPGLREQGRRIHDLPIRKGGVAIAVERGVDEVQVAEHIAALLDAEIPVMGHVGLTPQSVQSCGTQGLESPRDSVGKWLQS